MNLTDMYLTYLEQKEGKSVILKEYGFISYEIKGTEILADVIYVDSAFRGKNLAYELDQEFVKAGKAAGCTVASCEVHIDHGHSKEALQVMFAGGFSPVSAERNIVKLSKKI